MNTTILMGALTRDPELTRTPGGTSLTKFSIAINDKIKSAGGEYQERVDYIDCTLFGKPAEVFCEYMAKGRKVAIEGKLRQDRWDDKETGKKMSKVTVFVERWHMCDSKPQGQAKPKAESYTPGMSEDSPF